MSSLSRSTRRAFLKHSGLALAGMGLERASASGQAQASTAKAAALDPSTLKPFVDPLPVPKVARPEGLRANPENRAEKIPYYRIAAREVRVKVHRDLKPTRMWSFGDSFPGPTIETQSGQGMIVDWVNELPKRHFLPIDHTLHGAERSAPEVRSVVHLHGGRTPAESDGYPESWTTPGQVQTCFYPCAQHAAQLFYHDHTMGINRLNIYAGMQGMFLIRDRREDELELPSGAYDIPLLVADRLLDTEGQLRYPVSEFPERPWVPEVFGNAILVNGKLLPYLEVEPRRYRLRIFNGSNGRFYRFSLSNHAEFQVIANDQGLLEAPATVKRLPLAPAERADIVVDFAPMAGATLTMVSDSFDILQFRVAQKGAADTSRVPAVLHTPAVQLDETNAARTRRLTLDERMDDVQRSMGMLLNNTPWHAPVTEKPVLHTSEIWELVNLTDDTHPIHLHLVRFRILDRRRFDTFDYQSKGVLRFMGPVEAPAALEAGWKDTVRADPGMVTRILVPFEGYAGRYVWHCHILEHEDNEMMRPYEVLAAPEPA
ncbi:multicopper oxidase family protein [Paracidobacterium acidisoli]|uniref:Bilirubin oxidase n=1 Tax=Paracidobacterium acidisoli TaxID=2303751 RepID=A0A372ITS0_9BACT|nr:multicopper oxidase domain-containing protein [Paracidobacterium acidisoli]MBT9329742.1 multicopper oxidase domain-containing protein [Paracidobacterium acidisoli]